MLDDFECPCFDLISGETRLKWPARFKTRNLFEAMLIKRASIVSPFFLKGRERVGIY